MNNKKKLINTFCTVLDDFLNDVYKSYPDASLYLLMQTSRAIVSASPSLIVDNFMYCIEPYINQIETRDSSFFLNGGLANNLSSTPYSFLIEEINKVSNIWNMSETSEKTKESIWLYFQALVKLGNKIKSM